MVKYKIFNYLRFDQIKSLGLIPLFIKMDKDAGQIWAAKEVWPDSTINLCLWHVLRAIKKRLRDPKKIREMDLSGCEHSYS